MAVPRKLLLGDRLRDEGLGDERLAHLHGSAAERAFNAGEHRARRQRVPRLNAHELPLDHLELVDAGLTHAAHAQQVDLHAGRLVREGSANVAAAVAVRDGNLVGCPVARKRLDAVVGHAALLGSPLRRLGHAVGAAKHVVLEAVEAHRMRGDVVLLVGALGHPHVRDTQLQGHVGVGKHGNPLVGMDASGVIAVGADIDRLHPDVGEPVRNDAGELTAPAPRRHLRIGAPEKDRLAVLGDILDDVGRDGLHAYRIHAPHMLGAPVPSFPAVWLARLLQEAADQAQQVGLAAVGRVNALRLAVAVGLCVDGERAGLLVHALDFFGNDVACLVPRDPHVFRHAAVLGVALAVGIPVNALERIRDAVFGVRTHLVGG